MYICLVQIAWVALVELLLDKEEECRMQKMLTMLAFGLLLWLGGSVRNIAAVNQHRAGSGTAGLEEALFRFGVPLADLPGPDVSDLPERYQQMVHRLLSVPPSERPPRQVCYYPGTDPKVVERVTHLLYSQPANPLDYYLINRWTTTAHGSTGSQGNPITLTYSFVPDGVSIRGDAGEPTSNNVLNATMNSLFGSPTVWKANFAQCFSRWSALSGVTYQEVSDDGATFPGSVGILGSRGDVRIASHPIDGAYNILAYDYYPNISDMVLDSGEPWNTSSGDYNFLRNVVMHEHGHGLGIDHVCPTNSTKLLEPYYSSSFDGPQHDDIRAAQRNYGDHYENNDASGTATNLGSVGNGTTNVNDVGTDNASDTDWYKFTVTANKRVTAIMTPVGATYFSDPQNGDGSCPTPTTQLNTLDDQNLDLRLYGTDGSTILYNANTQPAGVAETVPLTTLSAAGTYYLRILNNSANDVVQLYNLSLTVSDVPAPVIAVTAPNGGETWNIGELQSVTWTSQNIVGSVAIDINRSYPTGNWESITAGSGNTGSFSWTVIGPTTIAARIRIVSVTQPSVGDTSNASFSIATLVPPNPPQIVIVSDTAHAALYWSPIAGGGIQYEIFRDSTANGSFTQLIGTTSDTSFVDSNAVNSTNKVFYLLRTVTP